MLHNIQTFKRFRHIINFDENLDFIKHSLYNIVFSALVTAKVSSIIAKSEATMSTHDTLASTSPINEEVQEQLDNNSDDAAGTLLHKRKSTLFASYAKRHQQIEQRPHNIVPLSPITIAIAYIEKMVSIASSSYGEEAWLQARSADYYIIMNPLLEKLFCIPASSAPVECVFSQGGLIMQPHCTRLGDEMLSSLVYLKCNSDM